MARFDIEDFVDRQPVGRTQLAVLLVCGLVCFIDGFDIFMIGKIAPAIAADFGAQPQAMGLVFLLQQIGLAAGAFLVSPLADRIGRRRALVWACAAFGLVTLASMHAQSLAQLAWARALAGLFMAAGMPIALALISETAPRRWRSLFVALALAGYSTGNAASGVVAAWLLDLHGWQSGFLIGGVVPLLCIPLLWLFVPESVKFLTQRDPHGHALPATVRRMDPAIMLAGNEQFVLGTDQAQAIRPRLLDVFSQGRGWMTAGLWTACMLSMTGIAIMSQWLPTFFQEMAGVPIQRFAVSAMIGYLGGLAGMLSIGWLMDRFAPTRMIPLYYLALAGTIVAMAWIPFEAAIFVLVLITFNFMQTGGQGGLNTLITQLYPPRMRSTALGWAGGAGRIGGVIAPLFGAFALERHLSLASTLALAATGPLVVALLVLFIRAPARSTPSAAQPA